MLAACMQVESTFMVVGSRPPASEVASSALDEMAAEFEGSHPRGAIQSRLDASFAAYGLEPTEANYRMAADVLISLSNDAMAQGCAACTEMRLVEVIAARTEPGATWEEAAELPVGVLTGMTPDS